jgi:hypothetical protein
MSDYYKIDAVSNSMLSLLKRSPWTFYKTYVTQDPAEKMESEETDATGAGEVRRGILGSRWSNQSDDGQALRQRHKEI